MTRISDVNLMRTFVGFAAGGVIALVVLKILAAFVLPILGSFVALVAVGLKLIVLAAVVYFAYTLFVKRRREREVG
jgi:hypothetical protein